VNFNPATTPSSKTLATILQNMTSEDIQKIKKSIRLNRETENLNRASLSDAVDLVNSIITQNEYNNSSTITIDDVEFTDNFFKDKSIPKRSVIETADADGKNITQINLDFFQTAKLSNILFDIYYPKPTEKLFYHYTKISALSHILKGNLKLNSLIRNENYEEFQTFYSDHNILGYFENVDEDGNNMKDVLMKEIYTFCMASKDNLNIENENSLWKSFGDNKNGVRIEFEVETNHSDFRKIYYKDRNFTVENLLIKKLNINIENRFNRNLFIRGVSKIGMFYLPGSYKIENEVRFAIKKHTDDYKFDFSDNADYILLPFNSEYAKFKINKIKIGENCTKEQIQEIKSLLKKNNYSENIIE
jgi:hypothetical protein